MSTVDLKNTADNFYELLFFVSKNIFNPGEVIKRLSLPPSHIKVIFHLSKSGPSSVSEIANIIDIYKPNMTPIIDKLTLEGYVRRFNDTNDRRIIMIELTEKALALLDNIEIGIKKALSDKIATLSEQDLLELNELSKKMNNILSKLK